MILVRIYGGLAGQMLQYSLGKHLSLKNNTALTLDLSWFEKNHNQTHPREFRLNQFNTHYNVLNANQLFWKLRLTNKFKSINPFHLKMINEKDFSKFDSEVLAFNDNIVVDGYWNSYKYFQDIRQILIEEFSPKTEPSEINAFYLNKIKESNSISIHFRRGDYKDSSFHGILNKDYYERAINYISKEIISPRLFVFSDEPEWVLHNMSFNLPYDIIDFNKDQNNIWDIELMKNCKHNIIANSGFSWWGGWLNENSSKIVIAPEVWIAEQSLAMEDFIPSDWIRV